MGTFTENVTIKIDGDKFKDFNFSNITLTQELLRPNELRFTVQKKGLESKSIADSEFSVPKKLLGAEVELIIEAMRFDEENKKMLHFKGIIYNVEIRHQSNMSTEQLFDVLAFSPDILLFDHPHCFSYENDNLKKIVASTLDPYNIPNNINPRTTDPIPYTVQYNETNYQFLTRLAKRYGEWMYNDGEKWIFGEIVRKDSVDLDPRHDISNFRFTTNLRHHNVKHAHHNYLKYENPMKSNSDISDLTSSGYHTLTDEAKKKSEKWFKKATFQHLQCSNPEVNDIDEPDVSIKAQLYGEKTQQVVCSGSTILADLTIGSVIKIKDMFYKDSSTHSEIEHDDLIITSIVHTTETNGHYSNNFIAYSASSKFPPYAFSDIYPVSSAQRAVVMDNIDPEKLGRIRVQFLWQKEQDENLMTPWIRIAHPYAGNKKGFCFIPEIEEEVMVDFENGNAEKPYVVGALYHAKQTPVTEWIQEDNLAKTIWSRSGQTIQFLDYDKRHGEYEGCICIWDEPREHYDILFDSTLKLIRLISKGNIELYAGGDIIMEAGGTIHNKAGKDFGVKAGEKVHIESEGESTYQSKGKMDVIGDDVVLHSNAAFHIESNKYIDAEANEFISISAGGHASFSAKSTFDINSKATTVESDGVTTIKGATVMIN